MKKAILLLLICLFTVKVNAQKNWNFAVQLSALGNVSEFTGGMIEANALFSNNPYSTGQIGFYARRTISNHFSLQTGIDFSSIGFSYSIAEDYSLLNVDERHANEFRIGTCMSRIPLSLVYNSNLNCRNVRFVAGVGLAIGFVDHNWETEDMKTIEGGELGNTSSSVMKTEVHSTSSVNGGFISFLGVEKVYRRGNMFSVTFQGNCGFNNIAESTVNYTVDNRDYNHTFSNNGSYCGIAFTYYFLPVGSKKGL